jgi:hypothetical protein
MRLCRKLSIATVFGVASGSVGGFGATYGVPTLVPLNEIEPDALASSVNRSDVLPLRLRDPEPTPGTELTAGEIVAAVSEIDPLAVPFARMGS